MYIFVIKASVLTIRRIPKICAYFDCFCKWNQLAWEQICILYHLLDIVITRALRYLL